MSGLALDNERELIDQVVAGDQAGFITLYHHYAPQLKGYLIRLTGSRQSAEDLVHDVFLEVWKNRQELDQISRFRSYLFRAVHNRAHRLFQRKAQETLIIHHLQKETDPHVFAAGEGRIAGKEVRLFIQNVIEELTPQQKKIFLLSRSEELSHQEIADLLQINRQTVSNHLSDALKLIREQIRNNFGTYASVIMFLNKF